MGKLIASINVTLDGCCDHEQVIADDEHHHYTAKLIHGAAGLLFGRVTYELLRPYWSRMAVSGAGSRAEVVFARTLDPMPKYVVSRGPALHGWNSTVIPGEGLGREIRSLKERTVGDLVLFGSVRLWRALALSNLIDEFHLLVQPILAGRGPRLFDELAEPIGLAALDSTRFRSGVALMRFAPASAPSAHPGL